MNITTLSGYGDTIKVGDVVHISFTYDNGEKHFDGPVKITEITLEDDRPAFKFISPNGNFSSAHYKGNGWKRIFKLADQETTNKLNTALKYEKMYLRLYYLRNDFVQQILIPACWIAWIGNVLEAIEKYDYRLNSPRPVEIKRKSLLCWAKTVFFTGYALSTKIQIPKDFPVKIGD